MGAGELGQLNHSTDPLPRLDRSRPLQAGGNASVTSCRRSRRRSSVAKSFRRWPPLGVPLARLGASREPKPLHLNPARWATGVTHRHPQVMEAKLRGLSPAKAGCADVTHQHSLEHSLTYNSHLHYTRSHLHLHSFIRHEAQHNDVIIIMWPNYYYYYTMSHCNIYM